MSAQGPYMLVPAHEWAAAERALRDADSPMSLEASNAAADRFMEIFDVTRAFERGHVAYCISKAVGA